MREDVLNQIVGVLMQLDVHGGWERRPQYRHRADVGYIAEAVGMGKATTRKYLQHLVDTGRAAVEEEVTEIGYRRHLYSIRRG